MRNQGFTTTELVVTVGILALLTCIAVPTAIAYMPSYNAKRAARDIVSQMQLARIHAINHRVTTVAVFSPASFHPNGGLGHYMIYEDNDSDWIQDPGERVITPVTPMPTHVTLTTANFTSNGSGGATDTTCYGFDAQGVAARNGAIYVLGNVQLKNRRNEVRTISFHPTGKTQMSKN